MAKIRTLRRCRLFSSLNYRDLAILASHVSEEKAEKEMLISEEGKPSSGVVIIKKGKVCLKLHHQENVELEIGPEDFFGELSLIEGTQIRSINAVVLEPCEYLQIDLENYHHLMVEAPDVSAKIAWGILASVKEKMESTRDLIKDILRTH